MNSDPTRLDTELTEDERARTVKLMEDAAGVIRACSKTLRFGAHNYDPRLPIAGRELNVQALEREVESFIKAARAIFPWVPRSDTDKPKRATTSQEQGAR